MTTISSQQFVSMSEVMARLGVSRQTVYRWAWANEIPTVKIGRRRLVPMEALAARLEWAKGDRGAVAE